jgi:hypothetical protein
VVARAVLLKFVPSALFLSFGAGDETVDKILEAYLHNAAQIIGHRTPREKEYDDAVVDALRQGKSIKDSLTIAGAKYPHEAIQWNDGNINEIAAHYDYLRNHSDILKMIETHTKK